MVKCVSSVHSEIVQAMNLKNSQVTIILLITHQLSSLFMLTTFQAINYSGLKV